VTAQQLVQFMVDIAEGMAYVSKIGIVHRVRFVRVLLMHCSELPPLTFQDLATRNVLLDGQHRCKIADFGLARDMTGAEPVYETRTASRRLPVFPGIAGTSSDVQLKWIAVECLDRGVFSSASDVWAFGVTVWEILHFGATPYPGMTVQKVQAR